ncbi:MAG: tripartite tricarboxylate transporter substrate binding protein BugE [Burkholderiaceae bacterium]
MNRRRELLMSMAAGAVASSLPGWAHADTYPTRPIKLVIPFPPGGSTDIVGRLLASRLSEPLGQTVVVENRGGAGGTIGAAEIARANPDGYTIGIATVSTCGTAPNIYPKLPYDPVKDYQAITNIAAVPGIIVVHPSFPAHNFAEFIKVLKANPGRYNYGSSGAGGVGHMGMELFKIQSGTFMTHIGYRGAGPALTDVLAGNVPIMWDNLSSSLPYVKNGKLIAIGLAYDKRIPQLPDVPTFFELGMKDYDAATWYGLIAPAGTPKDIVAKLNQESIKIINSDDFKARLLDSGAFPIGDTPEHFAQTIATEVVKWKKVAEYAKVKV